MVLDRQKEIGVLANAFISKSQTSVYQSCTLLGPVESGPPPETSIDEGNRTSTACGEGHWHAAGPVILLEGRGLAWRRRRRLTARPTPLPRVPEQTLRDELVTISLWATADVVRGKITSKTPQPHQYAGSCVMINALSQEVHTPTAHHMLLQSPGVGVVVLQPRCKYVHCMSVTWAAIIGRNRMSSSYRLLIWRSEFRW